jgi:pimeloyl-ACP methyl ester carboxylesterase
MSTSVPVYIPSERSTIAALLTPPAGAPSGLAVLVCAPWGWDEVASYRARREWAEVLAEAGHNVLRFDLPGVGDSSGGPRDPDQLGAWRSAIRDCARWLLTATGAGEVVALGLGLGGLLARDAISSGAPIEQLILWGAPARGRNFVRETRAFAGMQRWDQDEDSADGGLEAGGFVLSAETLEALSESPAPPPGRGLRRALLLSRDGVAVDKKTKESIEAVVDDVVEEAGDGWGDFVEHPERSVLPEAVATTVADWLVAGEQDGERAEAPATPAPPGEQVATIGAIEERPWRLRRDFGDFFGVLATRSQSEEGGPTVVFLNAGAVRHTGPDRLWVELSRAAAAIGLRALRVDLEGIGETDGDPLGRGHVGEFYAERFERQVGSILNSLESSGLGRRFMIVGLCAGGYWGYRVARSDRRVERAVLVNAGALHWEDDLVEEREARKLRRAFSWRWWRRLLSGQIRPGRLAAVFTVSVRRLFGRLRGPIAGGPLEEVGYNDEFDALRRSGTAVTLAFSADEPLEAELIEAQVEERIARWPNIGLERLPGGDHTLRPLGAQAAVTALVMRELEEFAGASRPVSKAA